MTSVPSTSPSSPSNPPTTQQQQQQPTPLHPHQRHYLFLCGSNCLANTLNPSSPHLISGVSNISNIILKYDFILEQIDRRKAQRNRRRRFLRGAGGNGNAANSNNNNDTTTTSSFPENIRQVPDEALTAETGGVFLHNSLDLYREDVLLASQEGYYEIPTRVPTMRNEATRELLEGDMSSSSLPEQTRNGTGSNQAPNHHHKQFPPNSPTPTPTQEPNTPNTSQLMQYSLVPAYYPYEITIVSLLTQDISQHAQFSTTTTTSQQQQHEQNPLLLPLFHYDSALFARLQMDILHGLLVSEQKDISQRCSGTRTYRPSREIMDCIEYVRRDQWVSQSLRLGCWEAVDLSNENATRIRRQITNLLGWASNSHNILHSLLICNQKVVTMWSKSPGHTLRPFDVLLLVIQSEMRRRQWNQEMDQYREEMRKWRRNQRGNGRNSERPREPNVGGGAAGVDAPAGDGATTFESATANGETASSTNSSTTTTATTTSSPSPSSTPTPTPNPPPLKPNCDCIKYPIYLTSNEGEKMAFILYMARVSESMTLVFIGAFNSSSSKPTTNEEKKAHQDKMLKNHYSTCQKLKNDIATKLNRSYADFIIVSAEHHLMTERYLYICPGLIHFVLKDCVRKRVLAPKIIPLCVQGRNQNVEINEKFIRHHVWKGFQIVEKHREENPNLSEMNLCTHSAQYCFVEWFVDRNGQSIVTTNVNAVRDPVEHYQLYTWYLPFVSLQAIQNYNRELAKRLCS